MSKLAVAEFVAGIDWVRLALEKAGCEVVFANDIKEHLETRNPRTHQD